MHYSDWRYTDDHECLFSHYHEELWPYIKNHGHHNPGNFQIVQMKSPKDDKLGIEINNRLTITDVLPSKNLSKEIEKHFGNNNKDRNIIGFLVDLRQLLPEGEFVSMEVGTNNRVGLFNDENTRKYYVIFLLNTDIGDYDFSYMEYPYSNF